MAGRVRGIRGESLSREREVIPDNGVCKDCGKKLPKPSEFKLCAACGAIRMFMVDSEIHSNKRRKKKK
jgi:rRNA maturation endonuclease Nob1